MPHTDSKKILEAIYSLLIEDEYFFSFKLLKSKKELVRTDKFQGKKEKISIGFYTTVETLEDTELSIRVDVMVSVRFDILFKWAEKFYHNQDDLSTFREHSNVFDLLILNNNTKEVYENKFIYFKTSGENFDNSINKLVNKIEELVPIYFKKYESLECLYDQIIKPVFEKGIDVILNNITGGSWIFSYLALVKIINPSKLDELNEILYNHLIFLCKKGEPNAEIYYPVYKKAVEELKNLNF